MIQNCIVSKSFFQLFVGGIREGKDVWMSGEERRCVTVPRFTSRIHKTRVQLLPQVKAEAGTLYLILDRGKSAQHLSILTTFIVCYLLSVNETSKAGSWIEVTETNQSMKDTKVLNPSTCLLSTNLPTVSRLPHALSACALVSSDQSDSHSQVPLYKMADICPININIKVAQLTPIALKLSQVYPLVVIVKWQ